MTDVNLSGNLLRFTRGLKIADGGGITWAFDAATATLSAVAAAGAGYSDEMAQDAVFNAIADSATIDVTYNDAANSFSLATIPAGIMAQILTVDGTGSGLDADLLDGHDSGYFLAAASYTAADVLSKLLTVDGTGSGLDADTLDGHDTAYFLAASAVPIGANPTATLGLVAINGVATTFMRSDGAPALSQSITPTWTGLHTFTNSITANHIDIGEADSMVLNGGTIAAQLQINSDTLAIAEIHTHSSVGATFAPILYGARGRGTESVPVIVSNGDYLLRFVAVGYDGVDYAAGASIDFIVDGTPGSNDMPTAIVFSTTPDGAQVPVEALRIGSTKLVTFADGLTTGGVIDLGHASDTTIARVSAGVVSIEGSNIITAATYTAADVLAKLLTVDGSGSGLDADTLDGHDTAYFLAASAVPVGANPTASVGLTAVNGVATTFMRSDGAPALDQGIIPTWTGAHIWSSPLQGPAGTVSLPGFAFSADTDCGLYRIGTNDIGLATAGAKGYELDANQRSVMGALDLNRTISYVDATSSAALHLKLGILNTAWPASSTDGFVGLHDTGGPGTTAGDILLICRNSVAAGIRFFTGTTSSAVQLVINSSGQLLAVAGTAALPEFSFIGDPNTGMYNVGADDLGFATAGVLRLDVSTTAVTSTLPYYAPDGAVDTPSHTFTSDPNTGLYSVGADRLGVATGGALRFVFETDGRLYGKALHNNAGAVTGATNQYIASGTYTPTLTNTTNVAASTARACSWLRVGNIVTVSGQLDVDITAAGATLIGISLPIASALTTAFQLGGVGAAPLTNMEAAAIDADATNDRAQMRWVAVNTANHTMAFTFSYEVL